MEGSVGLQPTTLPGFAAARLPMEHSAVEVEPAVQPPKMDAGSGSLSMMHKADLELLAA